MSLITAVTHFARKDQCLDLPETVNQYRLVQMTPPQRKAYNQMKDHLVTELAGHDISAPLALTKIMKLRQISSGFAITDDRTVVRISEAKTTELMAVLEDIGGQAIIWGNFICELDHIADRVGSCVRRYGEYTDDIEPFVSGKTKYMVANPASAGVGLNLQNCSYQIFYSLSYSLLEYEQAKGRTHRHGQKSTCVYIHLVADKSIDTEILRCLDGKIKAQDLVHEFTQRTERAALYHKIS
jgi:SNF2 family DNA or RNA helicase